MHSQRAIRDIVWSVLSRATAPLSEYEISEKISEQFGTAIAPNSCADIINTQLSSSVSQGADGKYAALDCLLGKPSHLTGASPSTPSVNPTYRAQAPPTDLTRVKPPDPPRLKPPDPPRVMPQPSHEKPTITTEKTTAKLITRPTPVTTGNIQVDDLKTQIQAARGILASSELTEVRKSVPESKESIERIESKINTIESSLGKIPPIEIALLGPSRHGKSTLLNALAGCDILPTSDVKPCTAAIVRLRKAERWSMKLSFVTKEELLDDWSHAVKDARDYLRRMESKDQEIADDPRYLTNTLQRYIQLFKLNPEDDPRKLVDQIKNFKIRGDLAKYLGTNIQPKANSYQDIKALVDDYLSTRNVYWTIVNQCEISGPFKSWHNNLSLVDLPGTNDTNAQRAKITNSLREEAQAVAICTSDSNLGIDIESWLRNSSVLKEFVEARDSKRQRLFIIRTKLDGYQPDDYLPEEEVDEEEEERLYRAAIEDYKVKQKKAYHSMLREMVSPILPAYSTDPSVQNRRQQMLDHVANLPVHFVSAFGYEVFEGRSSCARRQMNRLTEHFGGDVKATGIPTLLESINSVAAEYLEHNYYEDLATQLETEVGLLGRYFQQRRQLVQTQLEGNDLAVNHMGDHFQTDLVPWLSEEVHQKTQLIAGRANQISNELQIRMKQTEAFSERRLKDKTEKWGLYAWNSLKATARKDGSHTTCRGDHIDIINDVCSVLVDDLLLVWSSYRDELVGGHVDQLTEDLSDQLWDRLIAFADTVQDPSAKAAAQAIAEHLESLTKTKRADYLRRVDQVLQEIESIRKPVHDYVQQSFQPIFAKIQNEYGTGCQQRMRQHLVGGFNQQVDSIKQFTYAKINEHISRIVSLSKDSVEGFGNETVMVLRSTVDQMRIKQNEEMRPVLEAKHRVLSHAVARITG